jgi:hypothetical protein
MALPTNAACANTKIRKREIIVNSEALGGRTGRAKGKRRVRVTQAPFERLSTQPGRAENVPVGHRPKCRGGWHRLQSKWASCS